MKNFIKSNFYRDKKVFVTGNTGFKGTWLCEALLHLGATVTGYALKPPTEPALYDILAHDKKFSTITGDIRDLSALKKTVQDFQPNIVFHLAAQPLVLLAYQDPVSTYETNVMGTVNILESVRHTDSVRSVVNVTTDKVYRNAEWEWGYRENDILDGYDPYSNSKSCSELVTRCYRDSFFSAANGVAISTMRAGNVIGGGDFSQDRIIPDCVRAAEKNQAIVLRHPLSVRPYQHVLEAVFAYLKVAADQYLDKQCADNYNVGPSEEDCVTTQKLTELFCDAWGEGLTVETASTDKTPHEANFLRLDCSRIKHKLGVVPKWDIKNAVAKAVEFYKVYRDFGVAQECAARQIKEFAS